MKQALTREKGGRIERENEKLFFLLLYIPAKLQLVPTVLPVFKTCIVKVKFLK